MGRLTSIEPSRDCFNMGMREHQIQEQIDKEIPLAVAMGLLVEQCRDDSVILSAPIARNGNHQKTAFGGSLFSIAVLSGWCLLMDRLAANQIKGNIVIQDSEIKYLQPVAGALQAECRLESQQPIERLIKMLNRKGTARIELTAQIHESGQLAVEFIGHYVVTNIDKYK